MDACPHPEHRVLDKSPTRRNRIQMLSGHGCFAVDLKRFGKLESSECWFCGDPVYDVIHTVFSCDAWHSRRRQAEVTMETDLNPGNLIPTMLISKEKWSTVSDMIHEITKKGCRRKEKAHPGN